jgi:hypothetical protein
MSAIHSFELQQALERLLRNLGYEVCGDDDQTGWYWMVGDHSSRSKQLPFDTIAEATLDAARDLIERTQELTCAALAVIRHWDQGDLAAAVRDLDVAARYLAHSLDPDEASPLAASDTQLTARDGVMHGHER